MKAFNPFNKLSQSRFLADQKIDLATLTLLGVIILGGVITLAFLLKNGNIIQDWTLGSFDFKNLLLWLKVPDFKPSLSIFLPTLICLIIAQVTMIISPEPKLWSRIIIVTLLFAVMIRYVIWRSLFTLNFSDPVNGIFSIVLFLIEILFLLSNSFLLFLFLRMKPRNQEADRMSTAVLEKKYLPSVDILIPTYNEPISILKRSVIGCQALDYLHKKVYILDDGKREEVKKLAQELGCEYITRSNNHHAKAGNLNHAISQTHGELIVVFDADFVPNNNFLTRTVGFFQNPEIGLVQTHQSFYNSDPIAKNLGLEDKIPQDVEIFDRQIQLLRDSIGSPICSGSSFIVRRNYLEKVGNFVTKSLSEDFFTGIKLAAKGYKVIYLGERLSAGLSAENIPVYIRQRIRWGRGTLQAFFLPENPLSIPGLNLWQRLGYLEGILSWLSQVSKVSFLFFPIFYLCLDIVPLRSSTTEWLSFFLPFYLLNIVTFSWTNFRSRSAIFGEIYSLVQCFPIALTVIKTLINPFSSSFKVTPKGIYNSDYKFNWNLAFPLIFVFTLNIFSLIKSLNMTFNHQLSAQTAAGTQFIWIWSIYNLGFILVTILAMLDIPQTDNYQWFKLQKPVRVYTHNNEFRCVTTQLSEVGAEVQVKSSLEIHSLVKIELLEYDLKLQGKVTKIEKEKKGYKVRIDFEQVSLEEYRELIKILFCEPDRWKPLKTPGELESLWLLCKFVSKSILLLISKRLGYLSRFGIN